jgi:hypothetical protein
LSIYGVGAKVLRFTNKICDGTTTKYLGKAFRALRGVKQGGIMCPIIFNTMADAVLRYYKQQLMGDRQAREN